MLGGSATANAAAAPNVITVLSPAATAVMPAPAVGTAQTVQPNFEINSGSEILNGTFDVTVDATGLAKVPTSPSPATARRRGWLPPARVLLPAQPRPGHEINLQTQITVSARKGAPRAPRAATASAVRAPDSASSAPMAPWRSAGRCSICTAR
ncbi:hypothetical protein GXW82_31110 [Streptacidiphilus sp. 4-A2]|nr:hypothetical protein [Streptacidiphilus sp. 4-A2]